MTIDLNFGSVVLLAHMDGVNASTTFVDVKGKTITASGNAQISTAQSKFGGASAYFDGTGDYLNVSAHADFGFSTGAWTAECWFYSTKASWAAAASSLMDFRESTGNGLLYVQTDGVIAYWNDSVNYACTTAMSLNAWHHVAVSYDGTTLKIFVNGVQENSTAAALDFSTARPLRIGATISASDFFQGYIDDLRITKGVARYSANFTPPTEAFLQGYDVLLLHGDGTNGSTTIVDSSPTPKTLTALGDTQLDTNLYKFGSASIAFDGTGGITTPNNPAFEFGTGDFTVEAWIRMAANSLPNGSGIRPAAIVTYGLQPTGNTSYWLFYLKGNGTTTGTGLEFNALIGGSVYMASADVSISQLAWHHVAASRTAGVTKLFLDGTELTLTTNTLTTQSVSGLAGQPLIVGEGLATGYTHPYFGHIDELRITKGRGHYTANFTPSTVAFGDAPPVALDAALVGPKQTLEAFGGGDAALVAPSPWLTSWGMRYIDVGLTAPSPTVYLIAHNSYGDNALFATAPSPTLQAYTGDNIALTAPSPTLVVTATGTALLTATLIAPSPTLTAAGTSTGMLRAAITGPSPNLIGYGGAVCSITGPMGTLVATGTTGSIMRASVTVPMAQLTATVTRQGSMSALLTAPSPRMAGTLQAYLIAPGATLTAIGSATITATYEAYALNLNHSTDTNDELTHYTNFPFTHVVRYKNSYYGANSTGLYLLEGTTDDGDPIEWSFKTGMTDLDSPQIKTVTYAYFGGRLGPGATVSIYPSEPSGTSYSYTTPRGQAAQNYRQQFGKGLKARYFAFGVSGSDLIELDSLDLTVATLTRRI